MPPAVARLSIPTLRAIRELYPAAHISYLMKRYVKPIYSGMPWAALDQLVALQREVQDLLPHVRAPLLLLHGLRDHTAPVADSARIVQGVGSIRVQRLVLPHSFHQIGLDVDREAAVGAVVEFAESELRASAQESP